MKTKPIFKEYDREVYLSEYVRIHRDKYRRMVVSEVISWGISIFLLLVMVLR